MENIFKGDDTYTIDCTGDAVVGDEVCFSRTCFVGEYPKAKFDGYKTVTATIIRDSYGVDRGQHTFTLRDEEGYEFRIKGRNLYGNGLYRKRWTNERDRCAIQDDKHWRGNRARRDRAERLESRCF